MESFAIPKLENKKFAFKQKVGGDQNLGNNNDISKSLQPITAVCFKHQSETITNFCSSPKCLIPLCPDCIQRHLEDHRGVNKSQQEVESIKASRIKCIQKLQKLSLFINNEMQLLTPPKKMDEILDATISRMREIKESVLKYVDQYFDSFEYDIEARVKSSQATIQKAESLHCQLLDRLKKFGDEIQFLKSSNITVPQKIKEVMQIDSTQENVKFNALVEQYKRNLSKVDIKVIFDEKKFQLNFQQTIKIYFKGVSDDTNAVNLQSNIKYNRTPVIHYFESGTPNLHIIELPKQNKKMYDMKSNWIAPFHHNSLLLTNGQIWLTGGASFKNSKQVLYYNINVSRFDTNKSTFDPKIAKVKQRYDHALVEYNGDVYIMGGYGIMEGNVQVQELLVQKINIDSLQVTKLPIKSTYGGQSRAIVDKNGIIWKLSQRGLQMYSVTKKIWSNFNIQNFIFYDSCAAVNINQSSIFVFGGYDDQGQPLKTSCLIDISDTNLINMTNKGQYDIPIAGGFKNNIPIIYKKHVFALQNNENDKDDDGQRTLLKFEGKRWQLIQK